MGARQVVLDSSVDDAADELVLSVDNVVRYLTTVGVMSEADVADGNTTVQAVPRRNNNLVVRCGDGSGYFIKQASALHGSRRSASAEGRCYSDLTSARSPVAAAVPELVVYDSRAGVLVLRLLPDHRTLRVHCATGHRSQFPTHIWGALGRLIASVHAHPTRSPSLASPVAHMIEPHQDVLAVISPGGLTVFEIAQTATIRRGLRAIADAWRPDAFVHGDLRPDNVMVAGAAAADIKLIDWELCGLADPMWDLGACLAMAVTLSFGRYTAGELSVPLIQATARQLWHEYRSRRGADEPSTEAATRATMFAAGNLVQSALDLSEQAGALSTAAVGYLQIAENVFADSSRATSELFALTT